MNPGLGFDRRISLDWLEQTALFAHRRLDLSGGGPAPLERRHHRALREQLGDELFGPGLTKARRNDLTVLTRLWLAPPVEALLLRDHGLALLQGLLGIERVGLHFGMALACYPFFADLAREVGRGLMLGDAVRVGALQRRMAERRGDRSTLRRAVQRVLVSLADWGLLVPGPARGTWSAAPRLEPSPGLAGWLLRAALLAEERAAVPLEALANLPTLFPFRIPASPALVGADPELLVSREGLDREMVRLRGRAG